ncbi:MAG: acyl-CoA dehydrogenase family protein, partial [Terracidiphilus sp.]
EEVQVPDTRKYGYHQGYAVKRAYRDVQSNRFFEGTSEINPLVTAGIPLKRGPWTSASALRPTGPSCRNPIRNQTKQPPARRSTRS